MSSSSSRAGTPDKLLSGGEVEKYWHSGEINGIEALYTTDFVKSITFEVDPGTSTREQRSSRDGLNTYKVRLEKGEHITHFDGSKKKENGRGGQEKKVIASLTFFTNKNRRLGPIGTGKGESFSVPLEAGKNIEFFWGKTGEDCLASIGARVYPTRAEPSSENSQTVKEKSVKSIGPFGGGDAWDDEIFTGVREVYVLLSDVDNGYIRFVYDKDRQPFAATHPEGVSPKSEVEKVQLDYPEEYLTSISGYTRKDGSIEQLTFYTNRKCDNRGKQNGGRYFGYPSTGTNKIVGFRGTWGKTLNSIGVYVKPMSAPPPLDRFEPIKDGSGGVLWDYGLHSHVIGYRVTASKDNKRIESITFMYHDNGFRVEGSRHGGGDPSSGEWTMLNFPEERLKSLTGYSRKEGDGSTTIHNLRLTTTSTTRPTRVYAGKFPRLDLEYLEDLKELEELKKLKEFNKKLKEFNKTLKLKKTDLGLKRFQEFKESKSFKIPEGEGRRISGFFGMAGTCLNSIGAYVGSY